LCEVGTTNRTTAEDYEAAENSQSAAVLRISPDGYCVVGETTAAEMEQLVPLCRDRELLLIDALGTVPLVDMSAEIPWSRRSLQASLAAGVNLAIVRGDGLTGGPACGILAGDAEVVGKIIAHPLYAAFRLDPPRAASLAATLSMLSDRTKTESSLPLAALLATPLENLRHRAERLAIQLAHAEGIRLAEAIPTLSYCDGVPIAERALPSYGIALTPADGDANALANRLAGSQPPIIGRIEGSRMVLDLRLVLPRQDASVVRSLAHEQSELLNDSGNGTVPTS
jgi:L-seryl-tRNA(Ser) seleniumtransferase